MRGRTVRVHFWVNAQGRVTRVELEPDIKDAGYRQQFLSMMKEYTFNPARTAGGAKIDGVLVMPVKF
jgi:TonB family protein